MQGSIALCLHYKVTEDFVRFELARVVKMTSRQKTIKQLLWIYFLQSHHLLTILPKYGYLKIFFTISNYFPPSPDL